MHKNHPHVKRGGHAPQRTYDPRWASEREGVGRFGWIIDPEGNRVELWAARLRAQRKAPRIERESAR